jgi:hypothetical protein
LRNQMANNDLGSLIVISTKRFFRL